MSGKKLMKQLAILSGLCLLVAFQLRAQEATLEDVIEMFNEGATYANDNQYKSAIRYFEDCIKYAEELGEEGDEYKIKAEGFIPNLNFKYTKDLISDKKYVEAIKAAEKTISFSEKYNDEITLGKAQDLIPQLHYQNAIVSYREDDMEGALNSINTSIELDPTNTKAYYIKSLIYKNQENEDGLSEVYAKANENAGTDKKTLEKIQSIVYKYFLTKGDAAMKESKTDEAITNLNKALEVDGSDSDPYLLLLKAYNDKSDWASAISTGNKALETETDAEKKAGIYFLLGASYYGSGDTDKACEAYTKAEGSSKYQVNADYQKKHVVKCAQ